MSEIKLIISNEVLNRISIIDEFKGEWKAIRQMNPDTLNYLKKVATIESVGSSNRIEGNKLSDKEVEKILSNLKMTSFKSRDEEEVAGYAEVSNLVFNDYEIIPFNENYIKQLHSILLKHSTKDERHRGEYKNISNSVSAFDKDGKEIGVVFETATPFETPKLMEELIKWTNDNIENRIFHPLIVIAIFVVRFLAIHPFQDGNGRLSRVLTNLLLLKSGYNYIQYSSLEAVVEDNKSEYYIALRKTQGTFKTDEVDYDTWIDFFIKILEKQKVRLEYKIKQIEYKEKDNDIKEKNIDNIKNVNNENKKVLDELPIAAANIYKLFGSVDRLDLKYIREHISESEGKIKRSLKLLQEKGLIKKYGVTNGCWYVRGGHY